LLSPNSYASQLLRQIRKAASPTVTTKDVKISLGTLRAQADQAHAHDLEQQAAELALDEAKLKAIEERAHQKRIKAIAAAPSDWLEHIDALVKKRNRTAYQEAADSLTLLSEACGLEMAKHLRTKFVSGIRLALLSLQCSKKRDCRASCSFLWPR
jgi:hypothetical protein